MLFSSLVFLFCFLPVALTGYYLLPKIEYKNIFLLLASLFAGTGIILIYLISIMYLGNSSYNPFIYFRF
jgi:alginate O-acetyltransferase complex protein AlgI